MGDFSHLNQTGEAAVVDVTGKQASLRAAIVEGIVSFSEICASKLQKDSVDEIRRIARYAGMQAAKQTALLIPLCHQVALTKIELNIAFDKEKRCFLLSIKTQAHDVTGVEMEAFSAALMAGATIYDMIKAVDPAATVGPFNLIEKTGGQNGPWTRSAGDQPETRT